MTPGKVARIRVNPKDAMGVVDVLEKLGVSTTNISFDNGVRIALSSLLESARQSNLIPTREGFEYLKMMERFVRHTKADQVARLELTNLAHSAPPDHHTPTLDDPLKARRRTRWQELRFKYESEGDINLTQEDILELVELDAEFTPAKTSHT